MFVFNCCFLICMQISQEAGQVVWYSHLFKNFPRFVVTHRVKGFSIIHEADVFMEFSCFFYDLADVGNLISGSSAFSKSSLNIWKFSVHKLLKPGLENFEHYFASMWDECNCAVVWTSLALHFFRTEIKTDLFQSCGHCWVFQICWHIEYSTFTASSFRIWNSSTGIPSYPLALFVVMLPKAHLTSHSRMSGCRWGITPSCVAAATAAKSLQLCPTLCDPVDGSPPGSPISGILQTRTLEWVAISFSKAWKWKVKVKSLSPIWLLATPSTAAYQAPPGIFQARVPEWVAIAFSAIVSLIHDKRGKNLQWDSLFNK